MIESELRAAIGAALMNDAALGAALNGLFEQRPVQASPPYAVLTETLCADWSAKGFAGRDVRLSVSLHHGAREDGRLSELAGHAERVIAALPPALPSGRIVRADMVRRRIGRDGQTGWAALIDYRFFIELGA